MTGPERPAPQRTAAGPEDSLGLQLAAVRFAGEGLGLPPIPRELRPLVHAQSPWVFGTRGDDHGPYDLEWFVDEVRENDAVGEYVLFGHDGRGVNSYAMHYYLVRRTLALFVQTRWGGVYEDSEAAARRVDEAFSWCESLIEAMEAAEARGALAAPARLVVVASDFYGWFWDQLGGGADWLSGVPAGNASALLEAIDRLA